jgi:hypothetical protein
MNLQKRYQGRLGFKFLYLKLIIMCTKLLSFCLIVTLLLTSTSSFADLPEQVLPDPPRLQLTEPIIGEVITPIKLGQEAPYTGVLLSPAAVASLTVRLNNTQEQIKLEVVKANGEANARCVFKLDSAKNIYDTEKGVLQVKLETSDAKIKILNEELAKQVNKQPSSFWFGVGVVGGVAVGILVTSFAVYAVNQASR